MHRNLTIAAVFAALVAGVSLTAFAECAMCTHCHPASMNGESRAYIHHQNVPSTGIALEGYCPVAYFVAHKPVMGSPKFTSTYQDVTYWFVNADAKKLFDENPQKYVPAYGGWCTLGMVKHDKFPVDPRNFKIVDGRLMLFLKNKNVDALELWNKGNERDMLKQADAFWQQVTK